VNLFTEEYPSLESYWRGIILFGLNVASFKFALGNSLLEIAEKGATKVSLEELAEPFSHHLTEHLKTADKQGTSRSSKFLDICRKYNQGEISKDELINATVKLGFVNVIDAFHIVNRKETPVRFFIDNRKDSKSGIILTDEVFRLKESIQQVNLPHEIEARWRLVETAWDLNISRNLINVHYDSDGGIIYTHNRHFKRINITSCRNALNGYQKGKCFYCFSDISVVEGSEGITDVDHFFPHILKVRRIIPNLNGIWNLVLACKRCNRGIEGKSARIPALKFLERLNKRNEFFIQSHHPLRETLISQTGIGQKERIDFLQYCYKEAKDHLLHNWTPVFENEPAF